MGFTPMISQTCANSLQQERRIRLLSSKFKILLRLLCYLTKQNNEDFHVNYYYDLSNKLRLASKNKNIDISELFNKAIESEINDGHKNLENQIFTNADICRKKHDKIVMGIVGLIPFVISMIGLIVLMILGYNL